MNIEQIISKYGIENPSPLAAAGCSAEEYTACVARNNDRVRKMTDEEYRIYRAPSRDQIAEDLANAEEHEIRHNTPIDESNRAARQ